MVKILKRRKDGVIQRYSKKQFKYKIGDKIRTKMDASSEYQNTIGTIVNLPKFKNDFYGIALVSNNGTKAIWAVSEEEIEEFDKNIRR